MNMFPSWYKPPRRNRMPADEMIRVVARHYGVKPRQVSGACREPAMVKARSIVAKILRERGVSYPVIGRVLGGRDHSTIVHMIHTWDSRTKYNPEMIPLYEAIKQDLVRAA